jgi:hypothetical protein
MNPSENAVSTLEKRQSQLFSRDLIAIWNRLCSDVTVGVWPWDIADRGSDTQQSYFCILHDDAFRFQNRRIHRKRGRWTKKQAEQTYGWIDR